jgi:hypothetical protein
MVDPESGAKCAIRDSGRSGAERDLWTVTVFGGRRGIGRLPGGLARDAARWEWRVWLLVRLFWGVLDRIDYWLTQTRLWLVDAVCGPEP